MSLWALLGAVVLVLSGCSAAPTTAPTGPVARAAAQDLRVAVGADEFLPGTPPTPNLGLLADGLNPGIFETLTVLTPSFGLRAGLALRWQARSATAWRFQLRPGVRFHDGTPLTAAAVVTSLQRLSGGTSTERGEVPLRSNRPRGLEPDSATAVNELTVDIALSEPNLRLAEQLADPRTAVQAAGTDAGNGSTPALTPTGTGPFRFAAYRPGMDLQVSGYPDYWDGAPELDTITFRFGADEDASLLLATGQVDAVGYVAAELLANVSEGNDRQVSSAPARAAFLLLNHGGIGPWSTLREDPVRQAVALAVDRPAVLDTAWPDEVEPNDSLIPAVVLGAAAAQDIPPTRPDPAAAEALLDEAGWTLGPDRIRSRDGQRLSLDLLLRQPSEGLPAAADSIGKQLAAIGIATTTTDQLPGNPTPLQRVNNATFDLFFDLRPQTDANPCALCRLFSIRPGGDLTVSGVVGAGPAADTLFDQAYAATSPDSARRLAADLMSVVITDQHLALPLATLPNTWLLSPQVTGFAPAAARSTQQWQNTYLTR